MKTSEIAKERNISSVEKQVKIIDEAFIFVCLREREREREREQVVKILNRKKMVNQIQ